MFSVSIIYSSKLFYSSKLQVNQKEKEVLDDWHNKYIPIKYALYDGLIRFSFVHVCSYNGQVTMELTST